jgi:hypothetical protein
MAGQIRERVKFSADVCRVMDEQSLLLGQAADAALGKRKAVDEARATAADAAWRDVLTTRYVYAQEDLQRALGAFDRAREAAVVAIVRADPHVMSLATQRLTAVRLEVLDAIQATTNDVNEALGLHLLPLHVRLWSRLRGRPAHSVAPKPSELAAADGAAA